MSVAKRRGQSRDMEGIHHSFQSSEWACAPLALAMLFPLPFPVPFHCNSWLTLGHPPFSGPGAVFLTSPSGSGFPRCTHHSPPPSRCSPHHVRFALVTVSTKSGSTAMAGIVSICLLFNLVWSRCSINNAHMGGRVSGQMEGGGACTLKG